MAELKEAPRPSSNFRQFFLRGLGVLLPTILTIYILVVVFQFVETKIAAPINNGVQEAIIRFTDWPPVTEEEIEADKRQLTSAEKADWKAAGSKPGWTERHARRIKLRGIWNSVSVAGFRALNLIGLLVAIILIYIVGRILGSYLGRGIYKRIETGMQSIPFFKQVYPYVKQVTDFVVGDNRDKVRFDQVVAVEYPRKGLWSVGLMTGDTMQTIEDRAGVECMTIFIPSSPTPFTGYVITVPKKDTIPLPITIDDALRFVVSGGVIVPHNQVIPDRAGEKVDIGGVLPAPVERPKRQTSHTE